MDESEKKFAESLELPPLKKKKKFVNKTSVIGGTVFGLLFVSTVLVLAVVFSEVLPAEPSYPWWTKKPVYRILVESFQDSDGDGLGDIQGITDRLDYVQDLEFGAIWLSNILPTQQQRLTLSLAKHSIPVVNFTEIEPVFGNSTTLSNLIAAATKRGMVVAMDINPLWTSTSNSWFAASRRRQGDFSDFFIWSDEKNNQTMEGYIWAYDRIRNQYYLCRSQSHLAVLNLGHDAVVKEFKGVFRYWSQLGVKGFNIGPVYEYISDPVNGTNCASNTEGTDCLGRLTAAKEFASVIHENKGTLFGFWDIDDEDVSESLLTMDGIVDFTVNIRMETHLGYHYLGDDVVRSLNSWASLAENSKAVWMLGDEYYNRIASHAGVNRIDINYALELLLPGGAAFYYGEELGLPNNRNVTLETEFSRTPMLWSANTKAGFTVGEPWLPIHIPHEDMCVETQLANTQSHLNLFAELVRLRTEFRGKQYFTALLDSYMAFSRWRLYESEAILVLINFSVRRITVNMEVHSAEYSTTGVVLVHGEDSDYQANIEVDLKHLKLQPNELLIVQYFPATSGMETE